VIQFFTLRYFNKDKIFNNKIFNDTSFLDGKSQVLEKNIVYTLTI
jgi:hypothetical protein